MEKITTILTKKTPHFHTIHPSATIKKALSQMCCENVDHLLVMDEGRFMGLITEHDISAKILNENKDASVITVESIMCKNLPAATTEDTVEHCMKTLRQHHIHFMPVFENFNFKGIISTDDILEEAVLSREEIFDNEMKKEAKDSLVI